MSKMKTLRWTVRLLLLAGALFFMLGGPLPGILERLIPALSPLSLFAESIAQRTWFAGLFWGLPPFVVLLLAFFKGRFFCSWICPLGTLYAFPSKLSAKKKILPVRLNALSFWIILSGSLIGVPAFLFLDPLSTFNRLNAGAQLAAWIPGLIIPLMLLLSIFQPMIWCTHLCPLGYCFELFNLKNSKRVFNRDRRQFIAGCGIGLSAAALLPKVAKSKETPSILPPGATDKFAETCTRCYACISVCPNEIIRVKKGGPLNELAMPELDFDIEACEEFCNRCTQVCPTGAIRTLNEKAKRHTKIGEAKILKEKCLAWTDNEYCMVCHEFCPYSAIEEVLNDDGTNCPEIIPELCRGCGACEHNCPAFRTGKAILVDAVQPQCMLAPK